MSALALIVEVGTDHYPAGDVAGTELLVRDVGHHPVLTGLYSRDGWDHPGPISFYLLALPYRLSGSNSIGLNLGALAINGAAIAGMVSIARRRGGTPLMLLTLVACGLLVRTFGPNFMRDVWNPYLTVMPFGLLIFLCWEMTCGGTWALPVGAGVATFCVQTHVAYVVLAAPLVLLGLGWLAVRAWRDKPEARRLLRAAAVASGLLVLFWLPPLMEQVIRRPGNLAEIADYFLNDVKQHHTVTEGYKLLSGQFGLRPFWLTGGPTLSFVIGRRELGRLPSLPVLLIPFAVAAVVAWRRGWANERRLAVVVSVTLGLGVLWVARTLGPIYGYRLGWIWLSAMLPVLLAAWVGWRLTVARAARAEGKLLLPLCLVGLVILAGLNSISAVRADTPFPPWTTDLASTAPSVLASLPKGDGDVVVRCDGDEGCIYAAGLFLALDRGGVTARVDSAYGLIGSNAPHWVHGRNRVRAVLHVAVNERADALADRPGRRLVAYTGTVSQAERRERLRRAAGLDAAHEAGTLDDIGWYVKRAAVTSGLGRAVGVFNEPFSAPKGRSSR